MGDRALIQLKTKDGSFSPVLYTHWSGSDVANILGRAQMVMRGRPGDLYYAFARLVVAAIDGNGGNTGFGVSNAENILTSRDSHGDAGCFVVDVTTEQWTVQQGGGYGLEGEHQFAVTELGA
ncbi:hypothetical protein ISN75_06710 [Dyella marensis]|uniref:hypothetical protein n=1 Tax=Dyella marensis TaxID=500610 RepID=UPI0031D3F334